MKSKPRTARGAFTLVELLIVLFLTVLIAALVLPVIARSRARSSRIGCINLLKQVGLGFRIFANDTGDQFPMTVSTNQGGSAEVATEVWRTFQVMSNELSSPKFLTCFADTNRAPAKNFAMLSNANVSFFVGLDADVSRPELLLAGERNLTNGVPIKNRVLTITSNTSVGWTHELHQLRGNIALSDGSVQQFGDSPRLQQSIHDALRSHYEATTNATLRLAMP